MLYSELIDKNHMPEHVAIIMDGNGRWAKMRNLPRTEGHQAGVKTVRRIMEDATRLGVKYLTLYTFSTENWNRPKEEVEALMLLLFDSVEEEVFMKNNVRFRVIGDMNKLPEKVRQRIELCIEHTANNTASCMVLALSYSSRWEITDTVKQLATAVKKNEIDITDIDEKLISKTLTTRFMPDPDLLIRTGGELRLSNYLLWQSAYTELYFCDTFWPDFDTESLCKAIYEYQQRERRFGKISEQLPK